MILLILWTILAQEPRHESVIVTGSPDPIPLDESDRAVRAFPLSPALPVVNTFADLLRLDSSLDVRARAPHAVQTDFSIRGSSFGQTLVLFNGLRLNDAQSGHHNLNIPFPLETLSSIEVLKGTGSTLYGADAVGGVVQFLPARPEAGEFRGRAAIGNFGTNQQRLSAAWVRSKFTQQVAATRDFSSGFTPNRDYRNLSVASSTWMKAKPGSTALMLAHNDRPFGAEQFYGNFNSWERTKAWFGGVRQELGPATEASFGYRRHTDLFVLYRDRPQVFTNRHATESWQGALRRRQELNATTRLYAGAEAFGDQIESNNLGHHSRARAAGYAGLDARMLRRFSLNAGVRDELWGSADHQWIPSVAGGFWLTAGMKLRASVSRAFRIPTYTDLYYQDPANRGTPGLRPERAWGSEAALDWQPASALKLSAGVFHRRETDGIDYVRNSPADLWRAANIQHLRFTGVELNGRWQARRQHLFEAAYTGLRGVQNSLGGRLSKYVFNYPVHAGVAGWQGATGPLVWRARLGAQQRLARDPYAVFDFYGAWTRGRWQPFWQFTNLSATVYQEIPGVAMPGRGALIGLEFRSRR